MNIGSSQNGDGDQPALHAQCLASYAAFLGRSRHQAVTEQGAVIAANPRLSPRARNMVVPVRPIGEDEAESLRSFLVEFFGSPDTWMIWSIFPLSLAQAGFIHLGDNPTMCRGRPRMDIPLGAAERTVEGLEIVEVHDDAGVDEFERVRAEPAILDADPGARRLYEQLGFSVSGLLEFWTLGQ